MSRSYGESGSGLRKALIDWAFMLPGLILAGYAVDGIRFEEWWQLLIVAAVLSVLNAILRPILIFFALPFVILTLGFGVFIINALLFSLAGSLVPGFTVAGFGSALLASLLASFINMVVSALFRGSVSGSFRVSASRSHGGPRRATRRRMAKRDDDVIDV
jgi:putative membrane protein